MENVLSWSEFRRERREEFKHLLPNPAQAFVIGLVFGFIISQWQF